MNEVVSFPGYVYDMGKSTYRGYQVGEGGWVYADEGIYDNVALIDIQSLHPNSIKALNLFGDKYTDKFYDLVKARVLIKHGDYDEAKKMAGGKLAPYLNDPTQAKKLADALKTAINSVYGLTSASFENPFRDIRNVDNIVAKRGALFMVDLKYAVEERGFKVAHIKTDSIKIPNATKEIIEFCMEFAKKYGYTFEHEATYSKLCLVNDAVYVAKTASAEWCQEHYGYVPGDNQKKPETWTATGAQFQIPYVFKTLFSKEKIEFSDLCEQRSVTTALYLDFNEDLEEDQHNYRFIGKTGLFSPVIDGVGGGILVRSKDDKYYAATKSKGYRWMESEMVQELDLVDKIDMSYFTKQVNEALTSIGRYGDAEQFVG